MRSPRRPLDLAATGSLALTACQTTVHANVGAAGITQDVAEAADTGAAHTSAHAPTAPTSSPAGDTSSGSSPDTRTAHEDASSDLLTAASDLSYATDEVITEITSGADAAQAMAELDDPFTTFANGCLAAGIQV